MKELVKIGAIVILTGGIITLAVVRHDNRVVTKPAQPSAAQIQLSAANQHITQLEAQITAVTNTMATQKTNLCTFIAQHVNTKTTPAPTDCQ